MRVFILALFVSFCTVVTANVDENRLLKIVDGDSVNVNVLNFVDLVSLPFGADRSKVDLKMRIIGIDAPEYDQTCEKIIDEKINCGDLATSYLKSLLIGSTESLLFEPVSVDYYKRILVRLFINGVDIGRQMVLDGMAYSFGDTYLEEELLARSEERGFWAFAKPPINPREWRKKK